MHTYLDRSVPVTIGLYPTRLDYMCSMTGTAYHWGVHEFPGFLMGSVLLLLMILVFCVVFFVFSSYCDLCAHCCQCLWIVHFWLPLRFSLTFVCIELRIMSYGVQRHFQQTSVMPWRFVLLIYRQAPCRWHTKCCIEFTSPREWFELTTLVVIDNDDIAICKSNLHTPTTAPDLHWYCLRVVLIKHSK
jgi:hypothetical protein